MELIDRVALLERIETDGKKYGITVSNRCNFQEIIRSMSPVDAEPVVRCKDCADGDYPEEECGVMMYLCPLAGKRVRADFYCADGTMHMDADAPERGKEGE